MIAFHAILPHTKRGFKITDIMDLESGDGESKDNIQTNKKDLYNLLPKKLY